MSATGKPEEVAMTPLPSSTTPPKTTTNQTPVSQTPPARTTSRQVVATTATTVGQNATKVVQGLSALHQLIDDDGEGFMDDDDDFDDDDDDEDDDQDEDNANNDGEDDDGQQEDEKPLANNKQAPNNNTRGGPPRAAANNTNNKTGNNTNSAENAAATEKTEKPATTAATAAKPATTPTTTAAAVKTPATAGPRKAPVKRAVNGTGAKKPAPKARAVPAKETEVTTVNTKSVDDKSGVTAVANEVGPDVEGAQPQQPNPHQPSAMVRGIANFMRFLSWAIMIVFPLFFVGLAVWAAISDKKRILGPDGQPVPLEDFDFTDPLNQAITVSASLWPIVFAAVIAQSLKAYAAFKVERGIQLMTLEQLIGSNSVGGAIKQPFKLRNFNITSLVLLVLWALSPLAGQAILRMTSTQSFSEQSFNPVLYFAPQNLPIDRAELGYKPTGMRPADFSRINTIYSGLMLTSNQSQDSSSDAWGNVKIPIYPPPGLEHDPVRNSSGWYQLDYVNNAFWPMSLLGIPVAPPVANHSGIDSFTVVVDTTSFVLSCADMEVRQVGEPDMAALNFTMSASGTLFMSAENTTTLQVNGQSIDAPGANGTIHFASLGPVSSNATRPSNSNSTQNPLFYWQCPYSQIAISNEIVCSTTGSGDSILPFQCQVVNQKPLDNYQDFKPLPYYTIAAMTQFGNQGDGSSGDAKSSTDTENYLKEPYFASTKSNDELSAEALVDLSTVNSSWMSVNLAQLINTVFTAGTRHTLFLGSPLNKVPASDQIPITSVTATVERSAILEYKAVWAWIGVLIGCSVVLLVFGISATIFETRTIGPDFLGFANTAIKRSVKFPKEMSNLSARDRLLAMQKCEVLLQDVRPKAGVGRVALGLKDESSQRLLKDRRYL